MWKEPKLNAENNFAELSLVFDPDALQLRQFFLLSFFFGQTHLYAALAFQHQERLIPVERITTIICEVVLRADGVFVVHPLEPHTKRTIAACIQVRCPDLSSIHQEVERGAFANLGSNDAHSS